MGDPIEAERVRAEVRHRLFGGTPPSIRIGRFELGTKLGSGGMGVVYAARDVDLERPVAIKVLFDRSDDLRREAQTLAKLRHPNIVSVHEIGTWQELPFVAMELVEGPTLRAWLADTKRSWREIADVFAGAGRGLAAAHAAGLVHRDFKLDNVIVDRDGQARVVDFGLARPADDAFVASARGADVTTTATAAGTPAYMAPEVLRGEPATPRSDQFSFGVALYEALAGTRPYEGRTLDGLIEAIGKPRASVDAPRAIQVAVDRCLEVTPARRFDDLSPVIDALSPRTSSRRGLAIAGGGLAIAGVVLAWNVTRDSESITTAIDPCVDAGAAIDQTWGDRERAAITKAFADTKQVFAADLAQRAIAGFDKYVMRWKAGSVDACHTARTEPQPLTLLRHACLSDRERQLGAAVTRLATADAKAVERAMAMVSALPSVEDCSNTGQLAERVPLPQDAATVAKINAARDRLATARALFLSGNAAKAANDAMAVAAEVESLAYPPLTAEALLLGGTAAGTAGDLPGADPALERAYREGIAGRHDRVAAEAAIKLAHLRGHVKGKPEDGRPQLANAEALVRRLGGAHDLEAQLDNVTGNIEQTAGKYEVAVAAFERAEKAWRAAPGDHKLDIAQTLHNRGNSLALWGHPKDALATLRSALALMTEAVGPKHPYIAFTTTALTAVMRDVGDFEGARTLDEQTLASETARVGPEAPDVGFAHGGLGNDLRYLGRYDEAKQHFETARAIFVAKLGPEHPLVANSDTNIGGVLVALGRYAEAETFLKRSLAAKEKRGPKHPSLISTLDTLATLEVRRGKPAAAKPLYERSLAIGETALGKDSSELSPTLLGLGEVVLLLGDPKGAKPLLERSIAVSGVSSDEDRALTNVVLGRALFELGDREKGRAMVVDAVAKLTSPANTWSRDRGKDWLAKHP